MNEETSFNFRQWLSSRVLCFCFVFCTLRNWRGFEHGQRCPILSGNAVISQILSTIRKKMQSGKSVWAASKTASCYLRTFVRPSCGRFKVSIANQKKIQQQGLHMLFVWNRDHLIGWIFAVEARASLLPTIADSVGQRIGWMIIFPLHCWRLGYLSFWHVFLRALILLWLNEPMQWRWRMS